MSELVSSKIAEKTQSIAILCDHCGSPVSISKSDKLNFCCRGCEFVYFSLDKLGLGHYYSMRPKEGVLRPSELSSAARQYLFLDQTESEENFIEVLANGNSRIRLYLSGIHCAACIWLLEKLPTILVGVTQARVQFAAGEIEIDFDPKSVKPSEIAYTLNSLGYPPVPMKNDAIRKEEKKKERQMMLRIGVAAVCAANTMMLSVSLFQGFFTGIEEPYASLFRWLSALVALPAVLYSATPFYRTAIAALMTGALHIDLPIAAAIILTYVSGIITTLKGNEFVYFDSVTTLIFLLLVGRLIQSRAVARTRASSVSAWDLLPSNIRVFKNGATVEKPIQELSIDDVVEVLPGERIPADGVVVSGTSTTDSSFLTGESLPQEKEPGCAVLGGSINLESRLMIKVVKLGSESRLGTILKMVDKSQSKRTSAEDSANRLSAYFVVAVFFLASISYVIWSQVDPSRAFDITVSILIVTCPCALGLAIPAAATIALGRAKKKGIFIKHSDAFESLHRTKHFYFDKTGTLTCGRAEVKEVYNENEIGNSLAAELAQSAPLHTIAQAIADYTNARPTFRKHSDCKYIPGKGVELLLDDRQTARLGSLHWLKQMGTELSETEAQKVKIWSDSGFSISVLAIGSSINCMFALTDSIAPAADSVVSYLKKNGKEIYILSGDSQGAVNAVAAKLGIKSCNAHGELFPEQKAAVLSSDSISNCMIGDGLNDAPAMKNSDISIGLRGGVEATIEAASIYISSGKLSDLLQLLEASQKTSKVIRNNLCYAVGYNIIGGVLAVCGFINPLLAAILMPLSSSTIISYSLFSKTFQRR